MISAHPSDEPSGIVTAFVEALNRRDLDAARELMAQPSEMVFVRKEAWSDMADFLRRKGK